jgi:hypothetical protein
MKTITKFGALGNGWTELRRIKMDAAQCDAQGQLQVWALLQHVEAMVGLAEQTFRAELPEFLMKMQNVKFQLFDLPNRGEELTLEARLVQIERRRFQYRVYAHVLKNGKRSKRVGKAVYDYSAMLKLAHVG